MHCSYALSKSQRCLFRHCSDLDGCVGSRGARGNASMNHANASTYTKVAFRVLPRPRLFGRKSGTQDPDKIIEVSIDEDLLALFYFLLKQIDHG